MPEPSTNPATAPAPGGFHWPHLWETAGIGDMFRQTPWTGWIMLCACVFAGLVLMRAVRWLCESLAARAGRLKWAGRGAVIHSLAGPLGLVAFTFCLMLGLTWIVLRPPMQRFAMSLGQLLLIVAAGWLLWNLTLVVEMLLRRITSRTKNPLDDALVPLVRRTLRIVLCVMLVLFVAENVFHADVTSFIAGLGIVGLAVSLAAQDTVKNFFGSIAIIVDQPFIVGDNVIIDNWSGTVIDMGFRSTRIRVPDGSVVTIPNSRIMDSSIVNTSRRSSLRREMNISFPPDTRPHELRRAAEIVREVLSGEDVARSFDPASPPRVALDEFRAEGPNLKAFYWFVPVTDYWGFLEHAERINLRIAERFAAERIRMAAPANRTVVLTKRLRRRRTKAAPPAEENAVMREVDVRQTEADRS
jgi:MscS family membrane protein